MSGSSTSTFRGGFRGRGRKQRPRPGTENFSASRRSMSPPRPTSPPLETWPHTPGEVEEGEEHCAVCHRPPMDIICRNCGYVWSGRCRKKCVKHPFVIHLMDMECCPKCRSPSILEFHEHVKTTPKTKLAVEQLPSPPKPADINEDLQMYWSSDH